MVVYVHRSANQLTELQIFVASDCEPNALYTSKCNDTENKHTNWRLSQYFKEKGTCDFNEKVYELDQNINLPGLFVSRALWGGDQHAHLLQCVCLYLCVSLTQSGQHAKNSTRCKQPTRCNNFRLLNFLLIYLKLLHMFRATNSPIFRSTFLDCIYIYSFRYNAPILLPTGDKVEMEVQFHLNPVACCILLVACIVVLMMHGLTSVKVYAY